MPTDEERLDFLETYLHLDATGDEPVWSMFLPGVPPEKAAWDIRTMIDYSMKIVKDSDEMAS